MAIKVIDGKLWDGHRHFLPGETVTGLSEKEEVRLVFLKVAEKVDTAAKVTKVNAKVDDPYEEINAKDMVAIVADKEDIKELEALLAYEQQNKKRKTVLEAIIARMDELDEPENPGAGDPNAQLNLNLNPDDMIVK